MGAEFAFCFSFDFSYVAGPVAAFYVTGIRRAMSVFMRHGRKGRQHAQKRDGTNKVVVAAYTEHAARTRSHRRRSPSPGVFLLYCTRYPQEITSPCFHILHTLGNRCVEHPV